MCVLTVGFDSEKLILEWVKDSEQPVDVNKDIELPQFQVVGYDSGRCNFRDFSRIGSYRLKGKTLKTNRPFVCICTHSWNLLESSASVTRVTYFITTICVIWGSQKMKRGAKNEDEWNENVDTQTRTRNEHKHIKTLTHRQNLHTFTHIHTHTLARTYARRHAHTVCETELHHLTWTHK